MCTYYSGMHRSLSDGLYQVRFQEETVSIPAISRALRKPYPRLTIPRMDSVALFLFLMVGMLHFQNFISALWS